MRKLTVLLMLACASAQPAPGSSLAVSVFTLGIHANDHAHSVALRLDGDHLDVVLSHGERDAHDHGEAPLDHDHPAGVSEGDHVVHITAGDAANATPRRAVLGATPVLAISVALPVVVAPVWAPSGPLEPRARGVDHLRTVVLRL